ncbi:MAG: mandelate racemase [candidate division GAL15 bacterium]
MRVRGVEVYGYELTYAHGRYVMSRGRAVERLSSTVVRLFTDDGLDGWGEVCPLGATYLPAFTDGARAALRELAPALVGADPLQFKLRILYGFNAPIHEALGYGKSLHDALAEVHARMDSALAGHGYAKSPVDVACWDLLGKAAGLPVGALLGGVYGRRVPLYVAVPMDEPAAMAEFAQRERARGVRIFQLKLGSDPFADAERVGAVVGRLGTGWVLADANGGYTVPQAVVAARLLERHPQVLLEQPCPTLEECASVRRCTTLPLVFDEVVVDVHTLVRAFREGGAAAVNLKVSRVGGLSRARMLRDLAVALGLQLVVEDTWGGDLVTAATAHLAASTPPQHLLAASFMNEWNLEHLSEGYPRSEEGFGLLPGGSGLGVPVEPAKLHLLFRFP